MSSWASLERFHKMHRIQPGDVMKVQIEKKSPSRQKGPKKVRYFYVMKVEPSCNNGIGISAYEFPSQPCGLFQSVYLNGLMRKKGKTYDVSKAEIMARRNEVDSAIAAVKHFLPVSALAQIVLEYVPYLNPKVYADLDCRTS